MSRLIFEGDTTKRFGEKFPRPFIEQIRAYDDGLEVDIAFYFKVPNEQEKVDSFVEDLKNGSLSESIVLSVVNQTTLDRLRVSKNFDTLVKDNLSDRYSFADASVAATEQVLTKIISFADFIDGNLTSRNRASLSPSFTPSFGSSPSDRAPSTVSPYSSYNVAIKDDFYSLDGTRYMKIFATLVAEYNSSEELYIACFVKNGLDTEKYENQTSDLIFEKVLNKDRTITVDPIVAFKEQNGTFYYQQPLMSLSRRYHKTDDYGHTEMIKQFSDVLSGYSIEESNDLLTLLDTENINPRLLILIKNKIENFTDKSPATPTGRLYSQLASNIVLADSLINRQEIVNKRQFVNKKIVDLRSVSLPNLNKQETYGSFYGENDLWSPLQKPLISRNIIPVYNVNSITNISLEPPPSDVSKYFKIETSAYYLFDYEKSLNYKSKISQFINPYNIEQIFGKGSLASYFEFSSCRIAKQPTNDFGIILYSREKTYILEYFNNAISQLDKDPELNFHKLEGSVGFVNSVAGATTINFSPENKQIFYSTLMQRGFDTIDGLSGYRLSLFELKDYQTVSLNEGSIEDGLEDINLDFTINIDDRTMEFYDIYIRQKIFSILENVENYYNYASDFCSYNNVDGRFNDFFLENIRNQFEEPYPWVEAPFYYYAFLQMMVASINEDGTRRRDGILLDLESIRQASIILKGLTSPETGNLESLRIFYENLKGLVENYFTQGSGLDEGGEIYSESSDTLYELIYPNIPLIFERSDIYEKENIVADFPLEEVSQDDALASKTCEELKELRNEYLIQYINTANEDFLNSVNEVNEVAESKECDWL